MSDVLAHPNAALKQRAHEVDVLGDEELPSLCSQMAHAMYNAPGIGLAATQLGVMKRVIVFDLEDSGPIALCNPSIVSSSEETVLDEEGCLSFPGISVPVERAREIVCEASDLKGRQVRIEASDLFARLLQHECDHLDGILIIDRASADDRKTAMRRYMELSAER